MRTPHQILQSGRGTTKGGLSPLPCEIIFERMDSILKILIIRAGALGDTLMLMPAIKGLGKDSDITLAGRRPGIDFLCPYVNRCIDMETSGWHRLFMEETDSSSFPFPSPDHVVAFLNDPDCRLRGRLKALFPESSVNMFPVFPAEDDKSHIALYMAKAIQGAGLPIDGNRVFEESLEFPIMRPVPYVARENGLIVIHPGSGSRRKNYPPTFWLQLINEIRKIQDDNPGRILLLMGPAEVEILPVFRDNLYERNITIKFLPEKEELISILGNTAVYIGHDSGITHIAAMLGIHVIALFKESSIERWRPIGPNVRILKNGGYSRS